MSKTFYQASKELDSAVGNLGKAIIENTAMGEMLKWIGSKKWLVMVITIIAGIYVLSSLALTFIITVIAGIYVLSSLILTFII